jgi:hypothetical protein
MKPSCRLASLAALGIPLLLSGCSLLPTTRKLPVPKAPATVQTITPQQLVGRLNDRWSAINTLTAKVEFHATKSKDGIATDYPSVEGHILIRKPADLRVLGQYFGVSVFDMASDSQNFTLSIPHNSVVIHGSNSVKKKSKNTWENLRPGFFLDAMLVRGLESDDLYAVTADTFTVEDAAKKKLLSVPEYILSIMRRNGDSEQLTPVRVVYFHRDDLQAYQQDIYDKEGNLETQVFYAGYQNFEGSLYPSVVTIKRPIDEIQIILTVDDVHENQKLEDNQFVVQIPEGSKVQSLE